MSREKLIVLTKLWNAIDHVSAPEALFEWMLIHHPEAFRDPTNPNTMIFTYE